MVPSTGTNGLRVRDPPEARGGLAYMETIYSPVAFRRPSDGDVHQPDMLTSVDSATRPKGTTRPSGMERKAIGL